MNNIKFVLCGNKVAEYSKKSHTSDDLIKFYSLYYNIRVNTSIVKKNIINER